MSDADKALVARWFAAFPAVTAEVHAALIHPEFVNHPAPPQLRVGRDNFRRVIDYVIAAAPDQTYAVERLVAEGDTVIAFTRWRGCFSGDYLGVRGNGRPFDVGQAHAFRIAEGMLVEHWAVRDDLELFRQTGVAPPAPHG